MTKFDLGGVGKGKIGWKSVNLIGDPDILSDITNLDEFCEDNKVDEFKMSHVYEHIEVDRKEEFLKWILEKLVPGGRLTIIQTDIRKVLEMYRDEKIDFYCLRDIIYTPLDRRIKVIKEAKKDLQGHKFMWGENELIEELKYFGFNDVAKLKISDWSFDCKSVYPFQNNEKYFSIKIPNVKLVARK